MPLSSRVALRLTQTRFHFIIKAIISTLVFYDLTPQCSEWEAVIFDSHQAQFYKTAAKNVLLKSSSI